MNDIQKAIDWFKMRKSGGTMPGVGKMYDTAISTLQDQAEREKGCTLCRGGAFDNPKNAFPMLRGYCLHDGIELNFCPICGRDLRKPVKK
jgi:hypothetical protein